MNFSRDLNATQRLIARAVGFRARFNSDSGRPLHIGFFPDVTRFVPKGKRYVVLEWQRFGLDKQSACELLAMSISVCERRAQKSLKHYDDLSEVRQAVVIALIFAYSPEWFAKQEELIKALDNGDFGLCELHIARLEKDKDGIADLAVLAKMFRRNWWHGGRRADLPEGW